MGRRYTLLNYDLPRQLYLYPDQKNTPWMQKEQTMQRFGKTSPSGFRPRIHRFWIEALSLEHTANAGILFQITDFFCSSGWHHCIGETPYLPVPNFLALLPFYAHHHIYNINIIYTGMKISLRVIDLPEEGIHAEDGFLFHHVASEPSGINE